MSISRGLVLLVSLLSVSAQAAGKTAKKVKASAAPAAAAAAKPAEPEVVPLAPASAPAASSSATSFRRVEATSDEGPKSPASAPPEVAAPASSAAREPNLFLGARGGGWVPLYFLRPGFQAGVEGQYRLPALDGRLRLSLYFGIAQATGKNARLVPSRGYDPAFIENVTAWPLELSGHYELWHGEGQGLSLGVGYGLYFLGANFEALGASTGLASLGHVGLAALSYHLTLGPGELGAAARGAVGAASLGTLGQVGTDSLTSFTFTLSYSLGLRL